MIILHGDNAVGLRAYLLNLVSNAKKHSEVVEVSAKDLTISSIESLLFTQELFSKEKTVLINGYFSLPKGNVKEKLKSFIASSSYEVVLIEKKAVKITDLKVFPNAKVYEFKTSTKVFQFVESVAPNNGKNSITILSECVIHDDVEMCFSMLSRQVRMLIKAKDGIFTGVPPFALAKLKKQAQLFSMEDLIKLYNELTRIDEEEKTSVSQLTLHQKLDLLLLKL